MYTGGSNFGGINIVIILLFIKIVIWIYLNLNKLWKIVLNYLKNVKEWILKFLSFILSKSNLLHFIYFVFRL